MAKAIDLTKQIFGQLEVQKRVENIGKYAAWECKCLCGCGRTLIVRGDYLRNGSINDCGKTKQRKIKIDYTGRQFENFTVLGRGEYNKWKCITDDNEIIFKTSTELSQAKVYKKITEQKEENQNLKQIRSIYHNMKRASEGEFIIAMLLIQNQIKFKMEYIFTDLQSNNNGYYRYDFYVDDRYIIEFDGKQHFKEIKFLGKLSEIQESDKIKTQYCLNNNIPLIRIPYTELSNIQFIDLQPETSKFLVKDV